MLKKIISYCLCALLALPQMSYARSEDAVNNQPLDQQTLYKHYPNARILHVTAEDYPELAAQLQAQGYQQAPSLLAFNNSAPMVTTPDQTETQPQNDCGSDTTSAAEESINVMLDISSDMLNSTSGSNRDNAHILFIIVGTIVIVAWVLYVFKYVYDVTTGFKPCGYWNEFTLTSSRISGSADQRADFDGLKYMTGFRDGFTEVGISIELGHANVHLPLLLSQDLRGRYWFLGPLLRWRMSTSKNPHYFSMNFLAGSTEHAQMGGLAQANLGLQFGLGESAHLGLSWGAMKIDVNDSQGILHDRDEYYYLYGINFGFKF